MNLLNLGKSPKLATHEMVSISSILTNLMLKDEIKKKY
jgi:hypothetical protein